MSYRKDLPTVLLVFTLGCGGKSQAAPDGGDGSTSSSGGVSSRVSASSGGSSGGSESDDAGASGSGSASSSGSSSGGRSSSGADGGIGDTLDAEIPDAFPASCGQFPLVLDLDGAPAACVITPADVACNANADCTVYIAIYCQCIDPVYGVNTANTIRCPPPPCPPIDGCPNDASGRYTQDCHLVPSLQDVAVVCVNHQCFTYAVGSK